jgi:hypothetical protein
MVNKVRNSFTFRIEKPILYSLFLHLDGLMGEVQKLWIGILIMNIFLFIFGRFSNKI